MYSKNLLILLGRKRFTEQEVVNQPLSEYPIGFIFSDLEKENDVNKETTDFNVEANIRQSESIVNFLYQNTYDWPLCQISDNCSRARCICTLTEKPRVECLNLKLHLNINDQAWALFCLDRGFNR